MNVFFLLFCVAVSHAVSYKKEWKHFKTTHGKMYGTAAEEQYRMKVFLKNKRMIDEHNKKFEQGLVSFTMGMNRFGDLTHHEFNSKMKGFRSNKTSRVSFGSTFVPTSGMELPDSVDWRKAGAVTRVKDQNQCMSCYAFSAIGALEGQHFIKHGKLIPLSEQQIVDCTDSGCEGGLQEKVFDYIKENGGIESAEEYPYTGEEGKCKFTKKEVETTDTGYVDISSGDEDALQEAVAKIGPISVSLDASLDTFMFYEEGIYYDSDCSSDDLDHGLVAVGYGTEHEEEYWLVKNSWGTTWGEHGYVKIAKNKDNHCGIATQSSYPIV